MSDNDDFDTDFKYGDHMFMDEETKSRFTNYSMSSSIIRRNAGLTLLDDRFEKVKNLVVKYIEYLTKTCFCFTQMSY